jgi:hypothetical protein
MKVRPLLVNQVVRMATRHGVDARQIWLFTLLSGSDPPGPERSNKAKLLILGTRHFSVCVIIYVLRNSHRIWNLSPSQAPAGE